MFGQFSEQLILPYLQFSGNGVCEFQNSAARDFFKLAGQPVSELKQLLHPESACSPACPCRETAVSGPEVVQVSVRQLPDNRLLIVPALVSRAEDKVFVLLQKGADFVRPPALSLDYIRLLNMTGSMAAIFSYSDDNADLNLFACNQAYAEFLGRPEAELTGRELYEIDDRAARLNLRTVFWERIENRDMAELAPKKFFSDDREIWSHDRIGWIGPGKVAYLSEDISSRVAREHRLNMLSEAIDASPISVVVTNSDGIIEYVNENFTRLTGYSKEETIGNTPAILKTSYHDSAYYRNMWETIRLGQYWQGDFLNRQKDGALFWEKATIIPIREEGEIRHFVALKENITETKALQQNLFKLQALIDHSSDLFFILESESGLIIEINEAACTALKLRKDKIIAQNFSAFESNITSGIGWQTLINQFNGHRKPFESVLNCADGSLLPVEIQFSHILFDNRKYTLAVARDIRERKARAHEVETSRSRLRALLDAVPDLVLRLNSTGQILDYKPAGSNPVFDALPLGLNKNISKVLPDDLVRQMLRVIEESVGHQKPASLEYAIRKNNQRYYFEARFVPNGRDEIMVVIRDISEGRDQKEQLWQSEQLLKTVLNHVPQMIYWKDLNSVYLGSNQNFARITGLMDPNLLVGKHDQDLPLREFASASRADDRALMEENRSVLEVDQPIFTNDGELRWFRINKLPLRNKLNKVIGLVGSYEDITERKRYELELQNQKEALESSNRELQEFAYIASHDLQEPLRKISTFGDRLQERLGTQLQDRDLDYLRRMQDAARRMRYLIEALLSYSRVTTKVNPFEKVELDELLATVLGDLEIRIRETGAQIRVEPLPQVTGDPLQIQQLFLNLINNALKFHKKDVAPFIEIRPGKKRSNGNPAAGLVTIKISDNGIGFDEKYKDRIFAPFQRLHSRDEYEGTGIGLAICSKIVKRHEGEIEVESKPGLGTTFLIRLPGEKKS